MEEDQFSSNTNENHENFWSRMGRNPGDFISRVSPWTLSSQTSPLDTTKSRTFPLTSNQEDLQIGNPTEQDDQQKFFITPFKICLYVAIRVYFGGIIGHGWKPNPKIMLFYVQHMEVHNSLKEPSFFEFMSDISKMDTHIARETIEKLGHAQKSYSSMHDLLIELLDPLDDEDDDYFPFRNTSMIGIFSRKIKLELQVMECELSFDRLFQFHNLFCSYINRGILDSDPKSVTNISEKAPENYNIFPKEDIILFIDKQVSLIESGYPLTISPRELLKKVEHILKTVGPEPKFECILFVKLGNLTDALECARRYFASKDEEAMGHQTSYTGISKHHYKYMVLADIYAQLRCPILAIQNMKQAVSVAQESDDQESLMNIHTWGYCMALEYPFLNINLLKELYRYKNNSEYQLERKPDMTYPRFLLVQNIATIRLELNQPNPPNTIFKKIAECRDRILDSGNDSLITTCNLLYSTAWSIYGNSFLSILYLMPINSYNKKSSTLPDIVFSYLIIALNKGTQGEHKSALETFHSVSKIFFPNEDVIIGTVFISKILTMLFNWAIYSENIALAEVLLEEASLLTNNEQISIVLHMLMRGMLYQKRCEYERALNTYEALDQMLKKIGKSIAHLSVECKIQQAELLLETGNAPGALKYAIEANNLSLEFNMYLYACKSLVILAEIERLLGHMENAIEIICANFLSISRYEDVDLHGKATLALASSLVSLYGPKLAKNGEDSHKCIEALEKACELLKISIKSFIKIWNISYINRALIVYTSALRHLGRKEEASFTAKRVNTLRQIRKKMREKTSTSAQGIMDLLRKIYVLGENSDCLESEIEYIIQYFDGNKLSSFEESLV